MTKIWKLQYDINREVAKISVLLSGKIDKYEDLTDEKRIPLDHLILSVRKSFWKANKNDWRVRQKANIGNSVLQKTIG